MLKSLLNHCLFLACLICLNIGNTAEIYPFFLPRDDGTYLEGFYSPPESARTPIVVAIQGSDCQNVLEWHTRLYDQLSTLGLGLIVLENPKLIPENLKMYEWNQSVRFFDHTLCLSHLEMINPEWDSNLVFWGEFDGNWIASSLAQLEPRTAALISFSLNDQSPLPLENDLAVKTYQHEETQLSWHKTGMETAGTNCLFESLQINQSSGEIELEIFEHRNKAIDWLQIVLFDKLNLNYPSTDSAIYATIPSLLNSRTNFLDYGICQGRGEVSIGVGGGKDTDGNREVSGSIDISKETDSGAKYEGRAEGTIRQDGDGNTRGEAKIEGRVSWPF
ncbi:MAG: hypothetical protein K2X08_07715 [Chlamydiales bacterium]|nr:hypothetical protein [Chlamydiales bacterium]MBY0529650.1 hypothetical protein [Rhabdochlamydiaceae bacterium]